MDCLFCRMVSGDIQPEKVYEDNDILAFNDITPVAPNHVLVIPKKHITTLNDITADDQLLLGKMTMVASSLSQKLGISENGYRLVMNCNNQGGQSVYHIHLHLLGGRSMLWPPG